MNKEIKILSLAFLFIFLGFNGVQQYVTSFFSEAGIIEVGFHSLILIYLFITLFEPFSAFFVSKYGTKISMLIGSFLFFIFIISLLSKSIYLIYLTSALLGCGASLLWMGQGSFLIKKSETNSYGKNSGFFSVFQFLGSFMGLLILGFLIKKISFKISFLFFSFLPLIGFFLIFYLKNLKVEEKINRFRFIKKSITSLTLLKLSTFYFSIQFIFGLVIGVIPIQIKNIVGIDYVGILSSLFFILPVIFSYSLGKLSDIKGRKLMIFLSYGIIIISLSILYFSNSAFFLILGIILIALNSAILRPLSFSLVGDFTTKQNLEFVLALFWIFQNLGIVTALIISGIFIIQIKTIYLLSIFITIVSFLIVFPLLKLKFEKIKEIISQEIS